MSTNTAPAKLKETDIAARKSPTDPGVPDDQIAAMLRGMVKSRRESAKSHTLPHATRDRTSPA